jgi:hypothetical protein
MKLVTVWLPTQPTFLMAEEVVVHTIYRAVDSAPALWG